MVNGKVSVEGLSTHVSRFHYTLKLNGCWQLNTNLLYSDLNFILFLSGLQVSIVKILQWTNFVMQTDQFNTVEILHQYSYISSDKNIYYSVVRSISIILSGIDSDWF